MLVKGATGLFSDKNHTKQNKAPTILLVTKTKHNKIQIIHIFLEYLEMRSDVFCWHSKCLAPWYFCIWTSAFKGYK